MEYSLSQRAQKRSISPLMTSRLARQKSGLRTSMPTEAATPEMVAEPQERSSGQYLGTKASPSLRYCANTPLPNSSPKA